MSFKNRVISALLCGAVLLGMTGCTFGKNFGTVATVSGAGKEMTYGDGMYLYYQFIGYNTASSALGEDVSTKVSDNLKKTVTVGEEEKAFADVMNESRDQGFINHAAVDLWFEAEGLTLDADAKKMITSQAKAGWDQQMKDVLEKNGVSYKTYEEIITNYYKQQLLFDKFYGPETENLLSDADLNAAVEASYMRRTLIRFPKVTAENKALSEEDLAKVQQLVNSAKEDIANGTEMAAVVDKYMPEVLKLTTKAEYTNAADYMVTEYVPFMGASYPEEQINLLKADAVGGVNSAEGTRTIYCWQKEDVLKDDELFRQKKAESENTARQTDFAAKLQEYQKDFTVSYNEDAVKYYDPKKIEL